MIIDLLLDLYLSLFSTLLGWVPDWSFPNEATAYIDKAGQLLHIFDPIIPMATLFTTLGIYFVFHFTLITVRFIIIFVRFVRGV